MARHCHRHAKPLEYPRILWLQYGATCFQLYAGGELWTDDWGDFKVRLELRKNLRSAFLDDKSHGSDSLYEHNEDQGASLRVAEPRGEPITQFTQ